MTVTAIIEIPQGSLVKYEHDKNDGSLVADRILNQPIPFNYGYIPDTLCGDGDPLDVFILGDIPLHPLCKVKVEIIGVLCCLDNNHEDDKLLAVVQNDTNSRHMGIDIIQTYLRSYKEGFEILLHGDEKLAKEVYLDSLERYAKAGRR